MKKILSTFILSLLFTGKAYAYTYINCVLTHMTYKDSGKRENFSSSSPGYMKFDNNLVFLRWDPLRKKFKVAESVLRHDKYELVFKFLNSGKIDGGTGTDVSTMTIDRISGQAKSENPRRIHHYNCKKISKSALPTKEATTKF